MEQIFLSVWLQIRQTFREPREDQVVVHGDRVGVGHQRVPQLLAPGPGEVEVTLLEEEHHELQVCVHVLLVGVPPVHQGVALQGQPELLADLLGLGVGPGQAGRQELHDLVLLVELAEGGLVGLVVHRHALSAEAPTK